MIGTIFKSYFLAFCLKITKLDTKQKDNMLCC